MYLRIVTDKHISSEKAEIEFAYTLNYLMKIDAKANSSKSKIDRNNRQSL